MFFQRRVPKWTVKVTIAKCTPSEFYGGCVVSSVNGWHEHEISYADLPRIGEYVSFGYTHGQVVSIIRDYGKQHIDVYANLQ